MHQKKYFRTVASAVLVVLNLFTSFALLPVRQALGASAISLVQSKTGSATTGNSYALAYTSNVTAGNTLIVAAITYDGGAATVSDSLGNTFTLAKTVAWNYSLSKVSLYYAISGAGGADTVTLTSGTSGGGKQLQIFEYSGLASSGVFDQAVSSASPDANGLSVTSPALAPAQADELLFAVGGGGSSASAGTGYTSRGSVSGFVSEDQIIATGGSYTASLNFPVGQPSAGIILAGFKAAGGTGGGGGGGTPDTTPPIISAISASGVGASSATVTWTTDENADSQLEYGTTVSYGQSTTLNSSLVTAHSVSVSSLAASTLYHYRVKSSDAFGNLAMSADQTFTTSAGTQADTTPPSTPTGLSASAISSSQINLSWTASTDNVGVTGYKVFRNGTQVGTTASVSYSDSGLTASTAYSYVVSAYDAAGNNSAQSSAANATTQAAQTGGGTTITWVKQPGSSGRPNANDWYTIPYDPVSGQTFVYATAGSGIYSSDYYFYNSAANSWLRLGGTASTGDACPPDLSNRPGDRHPIGQMAVDTKRNVLWLYGGPNQTCGQAAVTANGTSITRTGAWNGNQYNWFFPSGGQLDGRSVYVGGNYYTVASVQDSTHLTLTSSAGVISTPVQFQVMTGTEAHPRQDMYYLQLNANPANDVWQQVAVSPSRYPVNNVFASMIYDPDDDVLFSFGYDYGSGNHDNWVYCPTSGTGVLTSKQTAAGCTLADAWSEAIVTGGTHPPADAFPGMVYDTVTKKVIMFGGQTGTPQNQTWAYDVPTRTWTRKALSTQTPPADTTVYWGMPALAYNNVTHKVYYHQTGGSGAPADWEYDPVLDTWTQLSTSGSGAISGGCTDCAQVLAYDSATNALIGYNRAVGGGTEIWKGTLSTSGGGGGGTGDTTAPSTPTGLSASAISSSQINLSWTASTDNVGVTGYKVYRGGVQVGLAGGTTYADSGLSSSTTYSYTVAAYDAAGNTSAQSMSANATTQAGVVVTAPTISSFSANPTSITSGQSSLLSWTVSGATSVSISGVGSQSSLTSGSTSVSPTVTTTYTLTATNAAGNTTAQATVTVGSVVTNPPPGDTITITNAGGATTNYPVQIGRVFVQGEFSGSQLPQATVNGVAVPTQVDVKVRWGDGSIKHAILSFLIPSLGAGASVPVSFAPGATVGNTPLSQAQMLDPAYNFEATMALTKAGVTKTASARTMLTNGDYTVWTSGPIATTIILANHQQTTTCGTKAASKYDFGFDSYCPFRPIYEATFWPTTNQVKVRFIGEISDTEQLEDVPVDTLTLSLGQSSPATVYTKSNFTMYGASRWTRQYWLNGTPPSVGINHNLQYLIATNFVPNYDLTKSIPASVLTSSYSSWTNAAKGIYDAGNWEMNMGNAGGRQDIGPDPSWTIAWLYTGDARMQEKTLGNADLAAAWPLNHREGNASKFLDRSLTVPGVGKIMSVSTRKTLCLICGYSFGNTTAGDKIVPVGTISRGGWQPDPAHEPDAFTIPYALTGDPFYLDQMEFWASTDAADADGSYHQSGGRGPTGAEGALPGSQVLQWRGQAWVLRSRTEVAFLAPDGTPEKSYFDTLTKDAIAAWEGERNLTGTQFQGNTMWNWGKSVSADLWGNLPMPALHWWERGSSGFMNTVLDYNVTAEAFSPWEQSFVVWSLGHAKELGYPTDAILGWISTNIIGQATDPGYNPYLTGAYRVGQVAKATGQYFPDWAGVKSGFVTQMAANDPYCPNCGVQTATNFDGPGDLQNIMASPGDAYAYFASAAVAAVANQPGGAAAWSWMSSHVENSSYLNNDPKWAIIPRSVSSGGGGATVPVISLFSASPSSITVGNSATLSWTVSGATSVSIDNGVGTVSGSSKVVTPSANTTYTLTATNAQGNATAQTTVTVNLAPDTTNPTAAITAPTGGTVSGSITFSATASDPSVAGQVQSGLKSITLLVDGSVFATTTSASISKSLDTTTLSNAAHSLTATAQDNAGNTFTTSAISITVNNVSAQKYPRFASLTSLEALSVIPSAQQVTASVISPANGSVLETQSNLNPSAGKYTVSFLSSDPQLVNIRIKATGYLSQLLSNVDTTVNTASALSIPQLLAGDLNNDNTINSLDFSALNANWLKSGTGDINADGLVNSLDFAVLKNNFGKAGQ